MIISPKVILWPTDLSPLSMKAAQYTCGFRDIFGAELHVVHVCQPPVFTPPGAPEQPEGSIYWHVELLEAAKVHMGHQVEELFHANHPGEPAIHQTILVGTPWSEICNYAQENDVDLIILASHGRTGLKHVLVGSVAERVVQHATCPVLVVKSIERDFTVEENEFSRSTSRRLSQG